jgi:4'-phosphopantetheinyl transferase
MGFVRLWTLKEAYIKASGLGLAQPLETFAFRFDPLRVTFADPALGDPTTWHFDQRKVGTHHLLALAWRSEAVPVNVVAVRPELLLRSWGL